MTNRWPVLQDLLREHGFDELADSFPSHLSYEEVVRFMKVAVIASEHAWDTEFIDNDNDDTASCYDCGAASDALHDADCKVALILRTTQPWWALEEMLNAHAVAIKSARNRAAAARRKAKKAAMVRAP